MTAQLRQQVVFKVLHDVDQGYPNELKAEILDAIGDISFIDLYGQEVLCATFVQSPYFGKVVPGRPRNVRSQQQQMEDFYQAKCSLVLKYGNQVEAAAEKHGLIVPPIGAWVWSNVQDVDMVNLCGAGFKMRIDEHTGNPARFWLQGWPCRTVLLSDIKGTTTRPQDIV